MLDPNGLPVCPCGDGEALDHALRSRNPRISTRAPVHEFRRGADVCTVNGFLQTWRCDYCVAEFTVPEKASRSTMAAALRRMHETECPLSVSAEKRGAA
jgi:hypothetical protein